MNITGIEARDLLDAEIKQFLRNNAGQIGTIYMPDCFSQALAQCKGSELPELSGKFFSEGIKVLEKVGFRGFPVVLESGDEGFRIEPNVSSHSDSGSG